MAERHKLTDLIHREEADAIKSIVSRYVNGEITDRYQETEQRQVVLLEPAIQKTLRLIKEVEDRAAAFRKSLPDE